LGKNLSDTLNSWANELFSRIWCLFSTIAMHDRNYPLLIRVVWLLTVTSRKNPPWRWNGLYPPLL